MCSVHSIWFVKYVHSAKIWFMKTSSRIMKYETWVVKSNPDLLLLCSLCSLFYHLTCSRYALLCFTIPKYLFCVLYSGFVVLYSIYSHTGVLYFTGTPHVGGNNFRIKNSLYNSTTTNKAPEGLEGSNILQKSVYKIRHTCAT